ncbi:MAG: sortase [Anaerolineae bacterium]|nr:sortase [Anaerolineae bacterium]
MKRRLIALGIVSPLLLAMCIAGMIMVGLVSWSIFAPDNSSQDITKLVRVGPLLPGIEVTPEVNETPPKVITELEPQPEPGTVAAESQPAEIQATPSPTPDVEKVLGFALPANSVNSVTQQGIATRLLIPKLNLDAPVLLAPIQNQTWQVDHLGQAVGHLEGTAPPGSNSNIVLAGHVTLAAGVYGPFAGLAQLISGDLIVVYEGDKKFQYVVEGYQLVERTAIEVTQPTDTGQITLITCSNWNRDENRYEQRIIVIGRLLQE